MPVAPLDIERVRYTGEAAAARAIRANAWLAEAVAAAEATDGIDPKRIKRELLARSLQLTEGMAPDAFRAARRAAEALGVATPLEIFQAAGAENAAIHLVEQPALLEVRGQLLTLLGDAERTALFGHELGHFLAHGPTSPDAPLALVSRWILEAHDKVPDHAVRSVRQLSMAREITADRFGLLATGDLDAALRLEVVCTTGLSVEALAFDRETYLDQCRALVEEHEESGDEARGHSHPEHGVRAWALWLFSETEAYQELTGEGPGTRELAAVDARIERVLQGAAPDALMEGVQALQPLPEVHECALACAVMVAVADDVITDEEEHAIERAFGALVPDWQRYLSWDNAHEAFVDTGAVIAHGGARLQKGVFHILLQTALADGELSASEVRMISGIGDALRCGTLYRALIAPLLEKLGLEPPDADIDMGLRMPARSEEVDAAFDAVLQGVLRRGRTSTTLRRLCRLIGDGEGRSETRERIASELDERSITAEPPISDVELDQLVDLVAPVREEDEPVELDDDAPARQRLLGALGRLRDQLVSGDGRSPSIRLRRCRTGRSVDLHRLEALSVGHGDRTLALVAAGRKARLVDGREIGMHDGADALSRELLALEREATLRFEQTGAKDLFLGEPFLAGVFYGYLVRAPLILHPVDLARTEGRGYQLVPRPDDGACANQALIRLLFAKKGVPFPDELPDQLDEAAAKGIDALREVLGHHGILARPEGPDRVPLVGRDEAFATWPNGRIVIERAAVLGFFPQSTSDLIQDYDRLMQRIGEAEGDLGEALGAAGPLLPADLRELLGVQEELPLATDAPLVPVVPADPSQREVVATARATRTLVVDGPPGTGKSQVIVNLITDALARGASVAVVCEKRAAIDVVVQRLEQVGLRHLLGVVHDVHVDRRALYDQVATRLGEHSLRDEDADALESLQEEMGDIVDVLERRREALAARLGDRTPTLGQLHLLASSFAAAPLTGLDPALVRLELRTLRQLADRLGREAAHVDLYGAGALWRAPDGVARPSLADVSTAARIAVEDALREAAPQARSYAEAQGASGLPRGASFDAFDRWSEVLRTVASLADVPSRRDAFLALLAQGADPGLQALLAKLTGAFQERGWVVAVDAPVQFEGSEELTTALAVVDGQTGFFRFFSWAWWRARGVVRTALQHQWPAGLAASMGPSLVTRVRARLAGARGWSLVAKVGQALGVQPILPDGEAAAAWVDDVGQLAALAGSVRGARSDLEALDLFPTSQNIAGLGARLEILAAHRTARDALAAATSPIREHLPWLTPTPMPDELTSWVDSWATDVARVAVRDRSIDAAERLYPRARSLIHALADQEGTPVSPGAWSDALQHGWAVAAIQATEKMFPAARELDRVTPFGELAEAEALLADAVRRQGELLVRSIAARGDRVDLLTAERPEKGRRRTPIQKARETMLREAQKKRYVMSMRGFVRGFADKGLLELVPVWLVSPETMAVLFPPEPQFDLVVMDEASQCTVEKGFPALLRGRRAVVAGDEKQMPPSRFFELSTSDDDVAVADEVLAEDALSAESLLVLARQRCPHTGLRWHYRCVHEELIAFSNHAMYGGELFTIPSTATLHAPPALSWVSVPDGAYDKGANPIEADRVVDVVHDLLRDPEAPSVGIVTFNIQQRRVVLDRIDARCSVDDDFAARWSVAAADEVLDRRPFVKNLESVQGDERDVIVFSLGHAPTMRKAGPLAGQPYVPARFGPLGQVGGERRLNVAVSRAKRRCVVVSSFEPSMLTVAHAKHDGPRLLKAFLELVWDTAHGRRLQADRILERVRSGGLGSVKRRDRAGIGAPPLAAQIGEALARRGTPFDLDVGSSGFRVPLAVHHPEDPERYAVAVLVEEGHEAGEVLEKHVHQPGVLAFRGWVDVRVSAREWHTSADRVLERIDAGVERALAWDRERAEEAQRAAEAAQRAAEARAAAKATEEARVAAEAEVEALRDDAQPGEE